MRVRGLKFFILFTLLFVFLFNPSLGHASEPTIQNKKDLILINTSSNDLFFLSKNGTKRFKVATGSPKTPTPLGTFKIVNKLKNRPYYKLNIPGGSPKNPLGNRWLGLNIGETLGTTYAIHGNNNESSIGKSVSHGCIRMHNKELQWLFDHVSTETTVLIDNKASTLKYYAKENGYPLAINTFKPTNQKPIQKPNNESITFFHPEKKLYYGRLLVINEYNHSIAFYKDSRLAHIYYGQEWIPSEQLSLGRYTLQSLNKTDYFFSDFVKEKYEFSLNTHISTFKLPFINDNFNNSPVIVVNREDTLRSITQNFNYDMFIS